MLTAKSTSFTVCGGGVPAGAPSAIAAARDTQRKDTWVVAGEVRQGQGTWGGEGWNGNKRENAIH